MSEPDRDVTPEAEPEASSTAGEGEAESESAAETPSPPAGEGPASLESDVAADGEPEPDAATEPEPDAATEPEPDAATEPDAASEPEPDAASEPEPDAASESASEPDAASETPTSESDTEADGAAPDSRPESDSEADPKPPLPAPPEDVEPAAGMVLSFLVGLSALSLVCVIGSVIAALAVPRLGGVQVQENEEEAIRSLQAIAAAQRKLAAEDLDENGRPDFAGLGRLGMLGLIDPDLSSGLKSGYVFTLAVSEVEPEKRWMAIAAPASQERTGRRHFAINHTGGVYFRYRRSIPLNGRTCAMPPTAMPINKR